MEFPSALPQVGDPYQYLRTDCIAAPATGPGGSICIVRASGLDLLARIQSMVVRDLQISRRGQLMRVQLIDPGSNFKTIDSDALIACFQAPFSYTGEDVVEFHIHANPLIVGRLMDALGKMGVAPALPGEFSFRAVRNGRSSIDKVSSVDALIRAKSDAGVDLAFDRMAGIQVKTIQPIAESLKSVLAKVELGIDFSDQDVPELTLEKFLPELKKTQEKLNQLLGTLDRGRKMQKGLHFALLGRPNAGKSSLFNCLLGQTRALVSPIAGTTRDYLTENIVLQTHVGKVIATLVDTAGLRESQDELEKFGIESSLKWAEGADQLLVLVASDDPKGLEDLQKLSSIHDKPVLVLLTKSDLGIDPIQFKNCSQVCKNSRWSGPLQVSTVTGDGILDLVNKLGSLATQQMQRPSGDYWLSTESEQRSCQEALACLAGAIRSDSHEVMSSEIRHALMALAPLIGLTAPEEILGKIFSEFCIGK